MLESSPGLELGDVASCNLTMLQGGTQVTLYKLGIFGFKLGQTGHIWLLLQANVVPDSIVLTFDVRLPPTTDLAEWELMLLVYNFLLLMMRIQMWMRYG